MSPYQIIAAARGRVGAWPWRFKASMIVAVVIVIAAVVSVYAG